MIADEHIACFGWASQDEMNDIADMAIRVNDFLCGMFAAIGIRLVDFKLEFGRVWDGDYARIILADEISPDGCRLWDMKSGHKLDKDRFRQDLGKVEEAYQEVARRLGLLRDDEEVGGPRPRQPPEEAGEVAFARHCERSEAIQLFLTSFGVATPFCGYEAAGSLHHGEQAQRHSLHRGHVRPSAPSMGAPKRSWEMGFASRYGCRILVWFEMHETMESAILAEKRIKAGSRGAKLRRIEESNPDWLDLFDSIAQG